MAKGEIFNKTTDTEEQAKKRADLAASLGVRPESIDPRFLSGTKEDLSGGDGIVVVEWVEVTK